MESVAVRWISLWCVPVDWALFDELHGDDFEDCTPASRGSSKQAFGEGLAEMTAAFPDLLATVEDLVVDVSASKVAVRWSAAGTNRAAFLGIGPTHRQTKITGIEIIQISGQRIVKRWGEWDVSDHRPVP